MEGDNWVDITKDIPGPLLICIVKSRLSIIASLRTNSYEEVTGKKIGQVFDGIKNIDHENGRQILKKPLGHISTYHPFQSATDFAAAQWFLRVLAGKGVTIR